MFAVDELWMGHGYFKLKQFATAQTWYEKSLVALTVQRDRGTPQARDERLIKMAQTRIQLCKRSR